MPQFVISPVARIVEELADIGERRDKWWLRNPGAFVGIVERPVFPHPYDAKKPMSREVAVTELWPALRDAAGIPKAERYGWHSFRRAFANALRDVPLRELKDLGGWKNQNTVVMVYLRPDEDAQRKALAKLSGTR